MGEIHIEDHSAPVKTPRQVVILLVLAFAVPVLLIVMVSQLVTSGWEVSKDSPAMSDEAIARRLKPVGEVVVDPNAPKPEPAAPAVVAAAPAPAPAPAGATPATDAGKGKSIYDASCAACHAAGVAGAPKAGDKAAWAPRIKSGMDALYTSALKGKNAMPPKGGNLALSDADVKAAVDYLIGLAK